ncbi:hypothetical protein [Nocardia jejuensis]|uniref:hypothetical protein n=1 Tax=Nocardia jejuensis TaxID=328049 RepID=UPI000837A638|nr:hypothetical protein [Nocardia jejuensis]
MDELDKGVEEATRGLLDGRSTLVEFYRDFNAAIWPIAANRPLRGLEIEIFEALERWESSISEERPGIVAEIKRMAAAAIAPLPDPADLA